MRECRGVWGLLLGWSVNLPPAQRHGGRFGQVSVLRKEKGWSTIYVGDQPVVESLVLEGETNGVLSSVLLVILYETAILVTISREERFVGEVVALQGKSHTLEVS